MSSWDQCLAGKRFAFPLNPEFLLSRTELLRLHDRQNIARKNCILVKYAGDTRYDDNLVATHTRYTNYGLDRIVKGLLVREKQ